MDNFYLLLTPVLTLIVVALVGFVGCNWWFDLQETEPIPPPSAPTGLTAVGRDRAVDLTWDPYPQATKLTIKMGTSPGSHPTGEDITNSETTTYQWINLVNDQEYWFALTATANSMESPESDEVSAIPGLYGVVLPLLYQTQLGTPRQLDAWMGIRITTGPNSLTLRKLGRWFDANTTGTHAMRIAAAANPMAPLATVTVTRAAPVVESEFLYQSLGNTIQLAANTEYFVVSQETLTGGYFRDSDSTRVTVIDPLACVDVRAAFGDDAGNYTVAPTAGAAYGPVNLQYTRP